MNILITGARGFIGKNLSAALRNIRDGKDKTRPNIEIGEIYECDSDTKAETIDEYCKKADFVFHLAGVNRTENSDDFLKVNVGFLSALLDNLKRHKNCCPVMMSSSVQASCEGRYDNDYGRSKKAGEELVFAYAKETGARVLVYRFPNVFGKWCRPEYNSAVATFCHNVARNLPVRLSDKNVRLTLLYIDDLIAEMLNALEGKEQHCIDCGREFCVVSTTYEATLGEIIELLETFRLQTETLVIPEFTDNSFAKKLYSTYISYLPKDNIAYSLKMNKDERGSFTELLRTEKCGQVSVNIIKPGVTKGQHWHNSKWEMFIVVSGRGLIQQRKIGSDEVLDFEVSGEQIEAVQILPGYTHNITNLSDKENLVTVMWANEQFNPEIPDTFFEAL